MSMMEFAKSELDREFKDSVKDGDPDNFSMLKAMHNDVLEVLKTISEQGHTGFSITVLMKYVNQLVKYRPLSPLTGEEDEWNEIGENEWQNNRCPSVFKEIVDGEEKYHDIDACVFCEPNETSYWTTGYREYIKFPYTPTTKKIKLEYNSEERSVAQQMKDGTYTVEGVV